MQFCPRCGTKIPEYESYCPTCGYRPVIEEKANEEVPIDEARTEYERQEGRYGAPYAQGDAFHGYGNNSGGRVEENQPLSLLLQIIVIVLILMMPGIGSLIGVIAGVIFMGKEHVQYKKFGKVVLIISLVSIAFYILCCCMAGFGYGITWMIAADGYY